MNADLIDALRHAISLTEAWLDVLHALVALQPDASRTPAPAPAPAPTPTVNNQDIKKIKENSQKKNNKRPATSVSTLLTLSETEAERHYYTKLQEHYPRICQLQKPLTYQEFGKLVNVLHYNRDDVYDILREMENYAPLTQKYVSAYLTACKWLDKRHKSAQIR